MARTAYRLGIDSKLDPNPSLALGTSGVSPLELVSAYAPFANGGFAAVPHAIERIKGADGTILYARATQALGRIVDARYVGMMNSMMHETIVSGTGRHADLPGWAAAGKTGTSQDYRDAWFVGYTSHMVTGVWLGNDDNSPTRKAVGGGLPVDVWSRFMRAAHQGVAPTGLPGAGAAADRRSRHSSNRRQERRRRVAGRRSQIRKASTRGCSISCSAGINTAR